MKKLFLLILVLGLLLSGNAYAEKDHAHKKHGMSDDLFKEMDLDNNKFISEIEFNETYAKHSDDNHGSDDEHGSKEELFEEMDLNKDNSISRSEFEEIYKKHSLEHEQEKN
jgi:Ca2+-binding EF-hand superfamily protein